MKKQIKQTQKQPIPKWFGKRSVLRRVRAEALHKHLQATGYTAGSLDGMVKGVADGLEGVTVWSTYRELAEAAGDLVVSRHAHFTFSDDGRPIFELTDNA